MPTLIFKFDPYTTVKGDINASGGWAEGVWGLCVAFAALP